MLLVGSVFVAFAVEVVLVFIFVFEEVHVEPVHDGGEQVIVVARGRFLVELVPHVHLVIAAELTLCVTEQGELCYM